MAYSERHYIIVPIALKTQANAEAVKWDKDVGGNLTFGGAALSNDGGTTLTHYVASTLIDDAYVPPGQGGQSAMQVLNAFYATGWYLGYRIKRPQGDLSGLLEGTVEAYRLHPSRWEIIGEGRLSELANADAGMAPYVTPEEEEIPEWVQPTGSTDAYQVGDKVTHNGKTWECTVPNNTWSPLTYGWIEVV